MPGSSFTRGMSPAGREARSPKNRRRCTYRMSTRRLPLCHGRRTERVCYRRALWSNDFWRFRNLSSFGSTIAQRIELIFTIYIARNFGHQEDMQNEVLESTFISDGDRENTRKCSIRLPLHNWEDAEPPRLREFGCAGPM